MAADTETPTLKATAIILLEKRADEILESHGYGRKDARWKYQRKLMMYAMAEALQVATIVIRGEACFYPAGAERSATVWIGDEVERIANGLRLTLPNLRSVAYKASMREKWLDIATATIATMAFVLAGLNMEDSVPLAVASFSLATFFASCGLVVFMRLLRERREFANGG